MGDGKLLNVLGIGQVRLSLETSVVLKRVLYVPDLIVNLFSVRAATRNNCKVTFDKSRKCFIKTFMVHWQYNKMIEI